MTTPEIRVTPDEATAHMVAIRGQLDANKPQGQTLPPGGIDPRILTAVQDQTLISRQVITTASGTADNSATAAQALGAQDRVNRARIGATPNLRDTPALPGGKEAPPKTWEEVMSPTALDKTNAQRIAQGKAPLKSLRDDPEFMSTARALYAKQGLSPAQIEKQIDAAVKLSEQPMVPSKPPETPRLPAPGFGEGFGDRWRSTEQGIKNLIGQGGPGAPGVLESWKGVNDSLTETLTNPVGAVKDEIKHFQDSPSLAYYLGEKSFDASATAATLPFGGEGAAARAGLPTDLAAAGGAGRMTETAASRVGDLSPAPDHVPSVATPAAHSPAVPPMVTEPTVPRVPEAPHLSEPPPPHVSPEVSAPRAIPDGSTPHLAAVPSQHIPDVPRTPEVSRLSEAAPVAARAPEPVVSSGAASVPDGVRASAADLAPSTPPSVAHTPATYSAELPRSIELPQSASAGAPPHPSHSFGPAQVADSSPSRAQAGLFESGPAMSEPSAVASHGGGLSAGAEDKVPVSVGANSGELSNGADGAGHSSGDHGGSGSGDGAGHGSHDSSGGDHGGHSGDHGTSDDAGPPHHPELSDEKRAEIIDMGRGNRPDPSEYLSQEFIGNHLGKFDDGATRFMISKNYDMYGIGQRDGTTFVMPTNEVNALIQAADGDPIALAKSLGMPEDFFLSDDVIRVDVPDPQSYQLRMPSGNEAGANDYWLPGGFLPDGVSEAVIDGGVVPKDDLKITDLPDMKGNK